MFEPPSQMDMVVIDIPDSLTSYDQSCNDPNSVAIQQSTLLKKQSKQPRIMLFIIMTALFIATFSIKIFFRTGILLDQPLWKWFAFPFVICCSQIVNQRIVTALLFLTEIYFVMKRSEILYFCYVLKRSVLYLFWLGSILLAWVLLIGLDAKGSKRIYFVTSTLATCVIGTGIWILKVLVCGLCDKKFFDKMQDLIPQQYVFQILFGVPVAVKDDDKVQLKWITKACIICKKFFIICDALNKILDDDDDGGQTLTNQEVETVVSQILKNLKKNELREIHEVDLLQVMKGEDVQNLLKLFEGAVENKVIDEASLKKWMVKVLNERKTLVHPSSDTITELNTIMSWIVLFLVSIIWLCFMGGSATNRVLVFTVTLVVFFFGTTWTNISGGIIFVFQQRPFDIGDCCAVDNERLIVEKMGIWQTVFLREDNEKLYCTTANLLTKNIINYNRSFEMRDILEIIVDGSTSDENIAALELKINEYVERNPKIWRPKHTFQIQRIKDMKMKYSLHITHAMNFQKNNRRSEIVLELKKSLEQLGIKYFSVK